MRQLVAAAVLSFVCVATGRAVQPAVAISSDFQGSTLSPATVIARYERAAGGAKVKDVRSLALTGAVSSAAPGSTPRHFEAVFVSPNRYQQVRELSLGTGTALITTTYDGVVGWVTGPTRIVMPGVQDPETVFAKAEFLRLMVGVLPSQLWTAKVIDVPSASRQRPSGKEKEIDCLRITDSAIETACFDVASGLPQETRFSEPAANGPPLRYAIQFGEYRSHDGLLLPHVVTLVSLDENKPIRITRINTFSVNTDVAASRFKRGQE